MLEAVLGGDHHGAALSRQDLSRRDRKPVRTTHERHPRGAVQATRHGAQEVPADVGRYRSLDVTCPRQLREQDGGPAVRVDQVGPAHRGHEVAVMSCVEPTDVQRVDRRGAHADVPRRGLRHQLCQPLPVEVEHPERAHRHGRHGPTHRHERCRGQC